MSTYQHLSVPELVQMLADEVPIQLVDIRDSTSFNSAHINGAINLHNENLADYIQNADLDKPLIVICYHGISSQRAADYLHQQGFENVYSLDGGYQAWQGKDA